MTSTPFPIPHFPPPWTNKCTAYVLPFYNSASSGLPLHTAYAPLEARTPAFSAQKEAGTYKGGLGLVQIIRYSETPVGAYDELVILPGAFGDAKGKGKDLRITGIWVNLEASLWNGRWNWNIPKHLARFVFSPVPTKPSSSPTPVKVEVFPHSDPPSTMPFFTATIYPMAYTPSFPFSSKWLDYLGYSTNILQPPLPRGEPAELEVGTKDWKRSSPLLKSRRARAVWVDMRQHDTDGKNGAGEGEGEGDKFLVKPEPNWWPGMGRWRIGVACEDAVLELGEPTLLID